MLYFTLVTTDWRSRKWVWRRHSVSTFFELGLGTKTPSPSFWYWTWRRHSVSPFFPSRDVSRYGLRRQVSVSGFGSVNFFPKLFVGFISDLEVGFSSSRFKASWVDFVDYSEDFLLSSVTMVRDESLSLWWSTNPPQWHLGRLNEVYKMDFPSSPPF